jgi:hypothetical protein
MRDVQVHADKIRPAGLRERPDADIRRGSLASTCVGRGPEARGVLDRPMISRERGQDQVGD